MSIRVLQMKMLSSERLSNLPTFAILVIGRACISDCKAHALLCTLLDHFRKKVTLAQVPVKDR